MGYKVNNVFDSKIFVMGEIEWCVMGNKWKVCYIGNIWYCYGDFCIDDRRVYWKKEEY